MERAPRTLAGLLGLLIAACTSAPPGLEQARSGAELLRVALEGESAEERREAVRRIEQPALLVWLAARGVHPEVQRQALDGLEDDFALEAVLRENPSLAPRIVERMQDRERLARLLVELPLAPEAARQGLARLEPGPALWHVAWNGPPALRLGAIERLQDAPALSRLALEAADADVRAAAVARVADPETLRRVLEGEADPRVRRTVARRLEDEAALEALARDDPDLSVRVEALVRLRAAATLKEFTHPTRGPVEADSVESEALDDDGGLGRAAALVLALRHPLVEERVEASVALDASGPELVIEVSFRPRAGAEAQEAHCRSALATLDVVHCLGKLLTLMQPDVDELVQLLESPGRALRLAALRREELTTLELQRVARADPDPGVRATALRRVEATDVLVAAACGDPSEWVALGALGRLESDADLGRVALRARRYQVRRRATQRLQDPGLLARVAREEARAEVRSIAVRALRDNAVLADIARRDPERGVRYNAVLTLTDTEELARLEAQGGTEGGLAACRRLLLEPEFVERAGQLSLRLERGGDDVRYGHGPEAPTVHGEWLRLIVLREDDEGQAEPLHVQEWAMPQALSSEEVPEWLDVVIDPEAFRRSLLAALAP